jgi:hypothetical protein
MIVEAAGLIQMLVSIGLIVDSCERLASKGDYSDGGPLAARIITDATFGRSRAVRLVRRWICNDAAFRGVLIGRVALLAAALAPGIGLYTRAALLGLVFATNMLTAARGMFGGDGSDQMDHILVAGLVATFLLEPAGYGWIGIGFIATQSLLSYAASGFAKLSSPMWREGLAVPFILRTTTFGIPGVNQLFVNRPSVGTVASRGVIAFECLFPLVLLLPRPGMLAMLGLGAVMHLSIAIVMGLNKFLLSWLATYPAIVVCYDLLR